MIDLIREMWATPDAQVDAYSWAAAMAGHWAIGAALGILLIGAGFRPWRAAGIISACYAIGWEIGQLASAALRGILTTGLVWDSMLDAVAVSLGTVAAASLWLHRRVIAAATVAAAVVILTAGVSRRK